MAALVVAVFCGGGGGVEMGCCWPVGEIWREGTLEAAEKAEDEGAANRSGSLLLREDLSAARSPVWTVLLWWTALLLLAARRCDGREGVALLGLLKLR
jgi:hypothetical protein